MPYTYKNFLIKQSTFSLKTLPSGPCTINSPFIFSNILRRDLTCVVVLFSSTNNTGTPNQLPPSHGLYRFTPELHLASDEPLSSCCFQDEFFVLPFFSSKARCRLASSQLDISPYSFRCRLLRNPSSLRRRLRRSCRSNSKIQQLTEYGCKSFLVAKLNQCNFIRD